MNKIILFVIFLCFGKTLVYGQKEVYELESNQSWENLYLRGISKNKKWIDYYTNTSLGDLGVSYIKEISTDSTFKFRRGYWGKFSDNGKWYSIKVGKDSLILVDLFDYKQRIYSGVKSQNYTVNGYVVLHNNSEILTLLNNKTQIIAEMDKISNYALHPHKDILAAIKNTADDSTVIIYDLINQSSKEISLANYTNISHISWDSDGKHLIGFGQNSHSNEVEIWCYNNQKGKIRILKNNHSELKRNNERIIRSKLLSHSGDKIIFRTEIKDTILSGIYETEEWDTSCSDLTICKHKLNSDHNDARLNVWEPKTDKILSLYNSDYPHVVYNDRNTYGIMYNSEESEPHFNFYPFVSLQAFDVKSRSISEIVDQQYLGMTYLYYSPSGNYLLYFQNNHWWLYEFKEHKNYNLTREIKSDFYDENYSFKLSTPFGFGGWTEDESVIYLYDKYDIWKVNVKSKKSKKLTDGAVSNAVYRIMSHGSKQKVYDISNFESNIIDSTKKIIVKAIVQDTLDEYVYILTDKEELKLLVGGSKRIFNIHQINENNYVYQEESLTSPTTIQLKSLKDSGSQTLVESNKNWNQYDWSKTKLFYYPLNEQDSVRAVLLYPAGYNPKKSYPMIVYVYEKQSTYLHKFLPPSYFNDIGFNILNYSINDYFVLLPDIHYEITQVGMSAVKCVESSVKKALTLGNIDKNKIGLIGHSFGGYETAYIITQSSLFKAAVAGAGVYDLTSFNFDIFKMTGQPEIMRSENIPFRMKNHYYESPENYLKNSPIHHFSKVHTPLLIWSGKNDLNVNPQQSIEGFLGLYRLRKPAKLLLYPNEGHSLLNNKNRKELTIRIKEWFDNYLK